MGCKKDIVQSVLVIYFPKAGDKGGEVKLSRRVEIITTFTKAMHRNLDTPLPYSTGRTLTPPHHRIVWQL